MNPLAFHRNGGLPPDDPQGLLYLSGRYLESLRVKNYSRETVYGQGKMLRYFRLFCEQIGVTQARQVTRAVVVNYQSYLYHYRKTNGTALTIGTQKHWLQSVANFFSWLTRRGSSSTIRPPIWKCRAASSGCPRSS